MSCVEGDTGFVYEGLLPYSSERVDLSNLERPQTNIMLIVGNPVQALEFAAFPNDGVGLARLEFIINNSIGMHPRALLEHNPLPDDIQQQIANGRQVMPVRGISTSTDWPRASAPLQRPSIRNRSSCA